MKKKLDNRTIHSIIIICLVVLLFSSPGRINSSSNLPGYNYRKQVNISNSTTTQTNYQMKLIINKGSGTDSGSNVYLNNHASNWTGSVPDDIRFTKSDGLTLLDYWIEDSNYATATAWIELDSLPAQSTSSFYLYYGNSGAYSNSNGDNTFYFFDDFPGASLDTTNKWNVNGSSGSNNVTSSICTLIGGDRYIYSKTLFGDNYILRTKMKTNQWNTNAGLQQIGFNYYNGVSEAYYVQVGFAHPFDTTPRKVGQMNNGPATMYYPATSSWSINTYYITEVKRASNHGEWFVNDVSTIVLNNSNYPTAINLPIYFRAYNASGTETIDWALVRKYSSQEPSFGTWGSEETVGRGEMFSNNYRILDSSINIGGQDIQTSTSYRLRESIGEVATGESTSTSYKLRSGYQPMQESYLSFSLSTTSVQMLPSINGLTGGTATGTFSATVITDNQAGYSLYINASTSPAMKSISDSFADYTPASAGIPDYAWSILATSSEFGFSPEGSDISQKFKNNGSSICATGTSDVVDSCWYNFSTLPETISQLYSSNSPSGTQTSIKLRAQSGVNHFQLQGTYQATIVTTAFTN